MISSKELSVFFISLWSSSEHLFQWIKQRSQNKHAYIVFVTEKSVGGSEYPDEHMSDVCRRWCQTSQSECTSVCRRGEEGGSGRIWRWDGSNGISL